MKTRFRLLPTILVCLGTLVLVSAGSILALSLFTTTSVVSDLVFRLVNQNLRGLELALRSYLDPATHEAEFLADRIRSGEVDFSDRSRLSEVAIGSLGAVPQITTLVVASAGGSTLQVSRTPSDDIDARWLRVQASGTEDIKIRRAEIEGTRYLVITKPITGYGDVPLEIGAYSVASEVNAPFRTVFRAAVIGVALFAAAMILSVFMSRMIAKPIRRTSAGTSAIASLDFDNIAPLPPSRIKEIDDLATSFNAMLVGLKSFGRYVPRALVNRLIRENRVGAGTEERELTVMFTDIADFTSDCEGMAPSEVAAFINHHLALVSQCIESEGGTIDKYIGDAVMAFWGAPDVVDDAPSRAARAAIAIRQAIAADNDKRVADGLPPVRIRIGIHTGPLIVGEIGAPNRINYTVVGDVVNATQRLEALGKEVGPAAESIVLVSSDPSRSRR